MSSFNVVFIAFLLYCGAVDADGPKDPALVILDSVGKIWETLGEAKITEVPPTGLHGETGRGKKLMQMAIPLIVGFKVAGAIVAALGALKVLVVKTVILSGFAIITSLALAGKYVYDKMKKPHHMEMTPYYYPQAHIMAQPLATWDSMYDVQTGSSDVATDLQGHFSQPLISTSTDNHTAFNFIPVAERKSHRPAYKTTVYKTTVRQVKKK